MLAFLFGIASGPTDEELVRRFKRGDRSAFDEFVVRYQDRVYTYCLRWMGNPELAQNVFQDSFLKMYKGLSRFRGESKLSTWVFRVVKNSCSNEKQRLRRRKHGLHEPLEGSKGGDPDRPPREFAHGGLGTDSSTHRSEAERLIRYGLSQLDEDQANIIILRDILGQSYEEIAENLALPKGTVRSRLHRSRKALADALRGQGLEREDIFD